MRELAGAREGDGRDDCSVCAVELRAGARFATTVAQEFDLTYRQLAAIGAEGWLKNMAAAT